MDSVSGAAQSYFVPSDHQVVSQKTSDKADAAKRRKLEKDSAPSEGLRKSARLLSKRKCQVDFAHKLPRELAIKIFSYLKSQDICNCCLVSKQWASIGQDSQVQRLIISQEIAFGALKWQRYFGEIGKEPPLPPDIKEILQSPCPFWPGKTVQKTHMLVLLPATVNGAPFTLNSLQELVKHPKQGPGTQYRYYSDEAKKTLGDQALPQSSWVLMTKDVLPDSRFKSYADQCKLVESWSQKIKVPYQVPGTLESATCILLEHVQSGTRLYSDSPYTYTRCHEEVAGYQMAVGGFAASGLFVGYDFGDVGGSVGVASLRKF